MYSHVLSTLPGIFGLGIKDALQFFGLMATAVFGTGGILGGLVGWFVRRSSASAQLSKTLFDASRAWVEQAQLEHARQNARIFEQERLLSERENQIEAKKLECFEKDGEIRQLKQINRSLQSIIDRVTEET